MAKNNPEETIVDTAQDNAEVTVIKKASKSVAFYALEEIDTWIGGTHYQLKNDKENTIPEDVAAILITSSQGYRR